jgi:hypothetical protein
MGGNVAGLLAPGVAEVDVDVEEEQEIEPLPFTATESALPVRPNRTLNRPTPKP